MSTLPPDIRLSLQEKPDYLYAEVCGPRDSHEISFAYWSAIAEHCRSRRIRNLLVHERLGDFEGTRDLAGMVDGIIAMGFQDMRIAFVDAVLEHLPDMEHGAILANERGVSGRVFASVQEADWWLRHGDD